MTVSISVCMFCVFVDRVTMQIVTVSGACVIKFRLGKVCGYGNSDLNNTEDYGNIVTVPD